MQNGASYSGEWRQGKKSGQGTFIWPDGERYVGQFANDVRWGTGTQYYGRGETYTGSWKNDLRDGEGEYVSTSPSDGVMKYSGHWSGGEPFGSGFLAHKDGRKFEGSFVKFSGSGRIQYPNGDSYWGTWDASFKRTGKGRVVFTNGDTYDGEWVADLRHGNGTQTYKSGRMFSGIWESGSWKRGKLVLQSGESYVGDFKIGNYEGNGVYVWKNGDRYEGEWKSGLFQGRSRLTFGNNRPQQDGYWENNKFVGTVEQVKKNRQQAKRKEDLDKMIDCVAYKTNRFLCAHSPNPDSCMSTKYGFNVLLYGLTCQ